MEMRNIGEMLAPHVAEILELKAGIAALNERKADVEDMVRAALGEGGKAVLPDGTKVSVSRESTTRRIDSAALKADHPDLYAKYSNESKVGSRVTVTPPKKED